MQEVESILGKEKIFKKEHKFNMYAWPFSLKWEIWNDFLYRFFIVQYRFKQKVE
jgi:hypothetical protein